MDKINACDNIVFEKRIKQQKYRYKRHLCI